MEGFNYIDDVSTLVLNEDKCIGCGLCTQVCPQQILEIKDHKAVIVDLDACMECGACVNNCPSEALVVSPGVG